MHARKEGERGIQNHVRDVGPYTRVVRVAGGENCVWVSTTFKHSNFQHVRKKRPYRLSARALSSLEVSYSYIETSKITSRFAIDGLAVRRS